jgi:hypothetical protein
MKERIVLRSVAAFGLGLLAWMSACSAPASESGAGPFPASVLADTGSLLKAEALRAKRAASLWGLWGGISIGYLGWEAVDPGQGSPLMSCVSYVGVAAGILGFARDLSREKHLMKLNQSLNLDVATGGGPPYRLSRETAGAIRKEISSLGNSLRLASRSGLRAGCVIPVLLSGIAFYGLSTGTDTGENLAGLALGGALVIGLPSMLRYMSLKSRLKRVEGLMQIWDANSLENGERK